MRAQLDGGRFRMLNEQLYTTSGGAAFAQMQVRFPSTAGRPPLRGLCCKATHKCVHFPQHLASVSLPLHALGTHPGLQAGFQLGVQLT